MKRIASFTIDHLRLEPGVYVSRRDVDPKTSAVLTTFDLRMTKPYTEPVIETAPLHALEHLGATYLRNDAEFGQNIVYFGPMGCRTGFYLVMFGDKDVEDIVELLLRMFRWIVSFEGAVPGATEIECGNCYDCDLEAARVVARRYLESTLEQLDEAHMNYPRPEGNVNIDMTM